MRLDHATPGRRIACDECSYPQRTLVVITSAEDQLSLCGFCLSRAIYLLELDKMHEGQPPEPLGEEVEE